MAFTNSLLVNTVFGNERVQHWRITADGLSSALNTGLDTIYSVNFAPQSMTTAAGKFAINEGVEGTSIAGTLGITGVASGDEFLLTVYGR